jgi:hypothetical protein
MKHLNTDRKDKKRVAGHSESEFLFNVKVRGVCNNHYALKRVTEFVM